MEDLEIPFVERDSYTGDFVWDKNFHIAAESLEKGKPAKSAAISIFRDGSRINNQMGCGYAIQKGEETLEMSWAINLDSRNSVYQVEVCAIKSAIDTLGIMGGSTDVTLYSDG